MWAAKEWIKKTLMTLYPNADLTKVQWDNFVYQPGNKAGIIIDPREVKEQFPDVEPFRLCYRLRNKETHRETTVITAEAKQKLTALGVEEDLDATFANINENFRDYLPKRD